MTAYYHRKLTPKSAEKLQRLLARRQGRFLSDEELQTAYDNLMGFAFAIIEMSPPTVKRDTILPIANNNYFYVAC